ncbi:MAG TPA: twin-arginine translocase TatA/TatE family subunit [Candidatus Saccharimonadales bacterium]|nr:twin-arginine translocase TatA/TatE family subunit [Candidatus Saccharimonadales bacterium]
MPVPQLGFLDIGAPELIVVLLILLLLFGSKKLPELSRSLGQSAHELKKGFDDGVATNSTNTDAQKKEKPSPQGNNSAS